MTINLCACFIVLLGAFIGMESPLTVTQMLWVNLIMDTFAAMALSSLPADPGVLNEKPRNPESHIISRRMLRQIVGMGLVFFGVLVGLWQLLLHSDVRSVAALFAADGGASHITRYEMGIFFSVFVMLQFWNLFNAKYFNTKHTLFKDIAMLFTNRRAVAASYSSYFLLISLVILLGQVLIVSFAGDLFSVAPLSVADWGWIMLLTSPVVIIPEFVRIIKSILR
jgi:Ca2+-transporting ATPase